MKCRTPWGFRISTGTPTPISIRWVPGISWLTIPAPLSTKVSIPKKNMAGGLPAFRKSPPTGPILLTPYPQMPLPVTGSPPPTAPRSILCLNTEKVRACLNPGWWDPGSSSIGLIRRLRAIVTDLPTRSMCIGPTARLPITDPWERALFRWNREKPLSVQPAIRPVF